MDAGTDSACPMEELMVKKRRLAVLPIAMLVLAACQAEAEPEAAAASEGGARGRTFRPWSVLARPPPTWTG